MKDLPRVLSEWLRNTLNEAEHLLLCVHLVVDIELEKLVVKQVSILCCESHLEVFDEVWVLSITAEMNIPLDQ